MPRLASLLALALILAACDSGEGSSLYDPDAPTGTAPVISSVSPSGTVLAGVDVITIEGSNFADDPALVTVVFDDASGESGTGTVLSASPTRLEVRTPNLPNEALRVRVAVVGAQDYSNPFPIPLSAAVVSFGDLGRTEVPFGVAATADGTAYLSYSNEGRAVGVMAIAPDGTRRDYFASTFQWPSLSFAGDLLVGVRRVRAVFGLPEGEAQQVLAAFLPSSLTLRAVAGAPDGSVYAGGNEPALYAIGPDGTTAEASFPAPIRALTHAGGTLYAVTDGAAGAPGQLLSLPADGVTLGAPTVLADLPEVADALAVAADGTVFVGLARMDDPVVTVSPGGAVDVLYPGVLAGPISSLAYGAGSQLYAVREAADGDPADLVRIETRRDGAR